MKPELWDVEWILKAQYKQEIVKSIGLCSVFEPLLCFYLALHAMRPLSMLYSFHFEVTSKIHAVELQCSVCWLLEGSLQCNTCTPASDSNAFIQISQRFSGGARDVIHIKWLQYEGVCLSGTRVNDSAVAYYTWQPPPVTAEWLCWFHEDSSLSKSALIISCACAITLWKDLSEGEPLQSRMNYLNNRWMNCDVM